MRRSRRERRTWTRSGTRLAFRTSGVCSTPTVSSLYDVANSRFWATHLSCMQLQHFDRTLRDLPRHKDRVLCYAFRIGIEEARESLEEGDSEMAMWAMARCLELL